MPQHVIQRGNNRQATFFAEKDYRFYLACLREAASGHDCSIHAYVLMTNHVHLLATSNQPEAMSLVMRDLGRNYVQYVNFTYRRTGSLWEGRFKSSLVDTQRYFIACCRYIELNPVRAGAVNRPENYRWSSHGFYALGRADALLTAHDEYLALGENDAARQRAYRQLFCSQEDASGLEEIRRAVNRGWPLGSDHFKDQIERTLKRAARPPKRGRPAVQRNSAEVQRD